MHPGCQTAVQQGDVNRVHFSLCALCLTPPRVHRRGCELLVPAVIHRGLNPHNLSIALYKPVPLETNREPRRNSLHFTDSRHLQITETHIIIASPIPPSYALMYNVPSDSKGLALGSMIILTVLTGCCFSLFGQMFLLQVALDKSVGLMP